MERVRATRLVTSLRAEAEKIRRHPAQRPVASQTDLTVADLRDKEACLRKLEIATEKAERGVEVADMRATEASSNAEVL